MSLINNMLRDLDKRRAGDDARKSIPNDVRPLPADGPEGRGRHLLLGVALVATLGYAAWEWQSSRSAVKPVSPPVPTLPILPPPVVAVPALSAPSPVAVPPAPTSEVAPPVAQQPVAATQADVRRIEVVAAPVVVTPPPAISPAETRLEPRLEPKLPVESPMPPGASPPEKSKAAAKTTTTAVERAIVGNLRLESKLINLPSAASEGGGKKAAGTAMPVQAEEDDWRRAQALLREQRPDLAEGVLRRVLHNKPSHIEARQALLGVLLNAKRTGEMVEILREGLLQAPEQTSWAMNLARLLAEANDYPGAWEVLSRSAPHATQNPDYQAFCGTVLQRLNRAGDALPYYRNALRLKPREGRWWAGMGIALEAEGKLAEARESYQRARASGELPPEVTSFIEQKLR